MKELILVFATLIGLPVLSYFVAKFGTTGYLIAKQRFRNQQKQKQKDIENE